MTDKRKLRGGHKNRITIAGIEVGPLILLVGRDDRPMLALMETALGEAENGWRWQAARGGGGKILKRAIAEGAGVLCMYDLGDSLHASKHQELVAALRATGVTVLATTHSPDVVNHAGADEVLVSCGGKVARLSDHPEATLRMKLMRAGEFWSSVGESWVAETAR
jgi:hypothetical protein